MNKIECNDLLKKSHLLYNEQECEIELQRLAREITLEYEDKFPLLLSVMGGAIVFTGKILPLLNFPLEFDYIHVHRYHEKTIGSSNINWVKKVNKDIRGKHILVLDDILDEGETMFKIFEELEKNGAKSYRCAVFTDKKKDFEKPVKADFVGLEVPNKYVFGYGLDIYGYWRNLPAIYYID